MYDVTVMQKKLPVGLGNRVFPINFKTSVENKHVKNKKLLKMGQNLLI